MKLRVSPTREEATRALRLAFAELYNELRRRGHDVVVRYDEPGDPLYIPHFVTVDGVGRAELNVRFFVEPYITNRIAGNQFGLVYIPTNAARQHYGEKVHKRSQQLTPNQLTGPALADWLEEKLTVERKALAAESLVFERFVSECL